MLHCSTQQIMQFYVIYVIERMVMEVLIKNWKNHYIHLP